MTFKDPAGCDIVPSSKMQSLVLCGSGAVKMEDVYKDECERLRKELRDKEALIVDAHLQIKACQETMNQKQIFESCNNKKRLWSENNHI